MSHAQGQFSELDAKVNVAVNALASAPEPVRCTVVMGLTEDGGTFGVKYVDPDAPDSDALYAAIRAAEQAFDTTYAALRGTSNNVI